LPLVCAGEVAYAQSVSRAYLANLACFPFTYIARKRIREEGVANL